jgi:hypothetical protein
MNLLNRRVLNSNNHKNLTLLSLLHLLWCSLRPIRSTLNHSSGQVKILIVGYVIGDIEFLLKHHIFSILGRDRHT